MLSLNRVLMLAVVILGVVTTVIASNTSFTKGQIIQSHVFPRLTKTKENSYYLHDKIVIKLKDNVSLSKSARVFGISSVDRALEQYSVTSVTRMFQENANQANLKPNSLDRVYVAQYTSPIDAFELAKELSLLPEVEYAEPWFIYPVESVTLCTPSDSSRNKQWALNKILTDSAWCNATGSDTVVIGILDTGVQWDHPDLYANIWVNPGEDGLDGSSNDKRTNGIDDDGNGKIDDWHGWDFGGANYLDPVEDNDPIALTSNVGHGTHVSGIADAMTNNNLGIAGVAYNCKLIPIKTASDNDGRGAGGTAFIVFGFQGMKYAADMGVDVVNCSWGGSGFSQFEQEMVDYASERGTLVVAAAGNSGIDEAQYPAAYAGVISVAARTEASLEGKASYSTFHGSVDVSAPGGSSGTSVNNGILSTYINDGYAISTGTSMAAPHVTGLVALVKSKFPELSSMQAGERIRVSATPIDNQPQYVKKLGKGRINAYTAVDTAFSSPSVRLLSYTLNDDTTVGGNGNGIPEPNDTIEIVCTFINYLKATSPGATITLFSPNTTYIQIISGSFTLDSLNTLETRTNASAPFKIKIGSTISNNQLALLRFDISDGSYSDYEWIELLLNQQFVTHSEGNVAFSVSNFGSLGYFDYNAGTNGQSFGNGFQYPIGSATSLFHATLMAATDSLHVVDNAFGNPTNSAAVDWKTLKDSAFKFPIEPSADRVVRCVFTDSGTPANRIGLRVTQRSYSFDNPPDDDYVILRYELTNTRTDNITQMYVGIYADWDVVNTNYNKVMYDNARKLGYMWDTSGSNYYGVSLLSSPVTSFRAVNNPLYIYNGFSEGNKYRFMTEGFQLTEGSPVNDWSFLISAGPFAIPPGGTEVIGFAFLGGNDLPDLQLNSDSASVKWDEIIGGQVGPTWLHLSIMQNPVLSRYADVALFTDLPLSNTPVVLATASTTTDTIEMEETSPQMYKGSYVFRSGGTVTLSVRATATTGEDTVISRPFSVGLLKSGLAANLISPDGIARLSTQTNSSDDDTYITIMKLEDETTSNIISKPYAFGPYKSFQSTMNVSFNYASLPVEEGRETYLCIFKKFGDNIEPVESWLDIANKKIYTETNVLGVFVVGYVEGPSAVAHIVPNRYSLAQNYPNPFNPVTTISFDLPEEANVTITIFNVLGQVVSVALDASVQAGVHEVQWDGTNNQGAVLPSGIYYYRLTAINNSTGEAVYQQSRSMMLIK